MGVAAVIAGLGAAALLGAGGTAATRAMAPEPQAIPGVHAITSGLNSERRRAIRITRRQRAGHHVVMSLHPDQLQSLDSGYGVEGMAELEVSTTCIRPQPRCVGRRYRFSPTVAARLVLAPGPRIARGAEVTPVSPWQRIRCSQRLPNRNHHCVLTIPQAARVIDDASTVACAPRCHLNLVANAYHRRASRGNRLVIGVADPGGVSHNKGQLAAAMFRPWAVRDQVTLLHPGEPIHATVPVGPNRRGGANRAVVHSQRLDHLRAGEQLVVDARTVVDIGHLSYNTLVQAKLVLSRTPDAVGRAGPPRSVGSFQGRVGVQNGFNCTQGPSGHATPCTVRKVGTMRILRDARERPLRNRGEHIPLYLNLVVGTRAVGSRGNRRRQGDELRIAEGGYLTVRRYGTELGP